MCNKLGRKKLIEEGRIHGNRPRYHAAWRTTRQVRNPSKLLRDSYMFNLNCAWEGLRDTLTDDRQPFRKNMVTSKSSKRKLMDKLEHYDNRARQGLSQSLAEVGYKDPRFIKARGIDLENFKIA